MTSPLPSNVLYGTIVGRFRSIIADTFVDMDALPDATPMQGKVTISADVNGPLVDPTSDDVFNMTAATFGLDSQGWMVDAQGNQSIQVIACDSPGLQPQDWTYTVSFGFVGVRMNPVSFRVHAGQTVHLSSETPVAMSNGVATAVGPPGLPGPAGPAGAAGPPGDLTAATADTYYSLDSAGHPRTNDLSAFGVFLPEKYGALGNGAADDTAAVNAAIAAAQAGGGVVRFNDKHYVGLGAIIFPNDAASPPHQKPVRLTGMGATFNGLWPAQPQNGGTILDLRYSGADGLHPAKIDTRGAGTFELDHITFVSGGTDNFPICQTTNTTLLAHDNAFVGNPAHVTTACLQDAFVLGGTNTGTAVVDGSAQSAFQGYGTVIERNYFSQIRRGVTFQTFANGGVVQNNTWSNRCGGDAAIKFAPTGATYCVGASITGNLIEMTGYTYGVQGDYVTQCFFQNNFYDEGATTLALYRFEDHGIFNTVIDGVHGDTHTFVSESAAAAQTNTVITSHQSGHSLFAQPVDFAGPTSAVTFGSFATFTGASTRTSVQPAAAQSDSSVLFLMRRSAAEGTNPGTTVWQMQQGGQVTVGGAQAGNVNVNNPDGTPILQWLGNGTSWKAIGAGRAFSQDSGTGGSYFALHNYAVQFYDHNAGPQRMRIGAGKDGFDLGAANDLTVQRDGQVCLAVNRPVKTQAVATAARPTAASVGAGAQMFDTTLNRPIWSTGAAWVDASGAAV